MPEKTINQELKKNRLNRLKKIDKKNYLIGEINQNELMSKNHKKVRRVLNYIDPLLILISAITGCVSIFAFVSLVGI